MHRARFSALSRALAATLAITVATSPALAAVHVVNVQADGTFLPKYLNIANGDTVEWRGLGLTDAVARLSTSGLRAAGLPLSATIDTTAACAVTAADDPAYVVTANPYRQPYEPTNANELTGPNRRGVSGIWALGPEGGEVSKLELPSAEATAIDPNIDATHPCDDLHPADVTLVNDPLDPADDVVMKYGYVDAAIDSGEAPATAVPNPILDAGGVAIHRLCSAYAAACDSAGTHCALVDPDPARPETIPPGTYLNGLLTSTYENPDVTGVVLRFNWKDLQYDGGGFVTERWQHLDRELDRAIAHGKLVTFDVRAGMFGTPDWIFTDWLRNDPTDQDDAHAAPWCPGPGPCTYDPGVAPADAGQVEDLSFVDHYDETPPGDGCGSLVRIGAPGDDHYRALYKDFISRLAIHLATDTRWWQAVAHLKASGANLRTSEAELPHHCNDDFVNTGDHTLAPKDNPLLGFRDRVLDVFKTAQADGARVTSACVCNTQLWFEHGYVPQQLYDYYAQVEQQILTSFFGEKSIGYQIIQDGFPRADATPGRSFFGDHLYREVLATATTQPARPFGCGNGVVNANLGELCDDGNLDETDGCRSDCMPTYVTNIGVDAGAVCAAPSLVDVDGDGVGDKPEVDEDRPAVTVDYCSADSLLDPLAPDFDLALEPVVPDPADPTETLAAFPAEDAAGVRYPASSTQAERVMDEAGNGRFIDPTTPGRVDRVTGKLFVPQHSGLQALPQEGLGLHYRGVSSIGCDQQLAPIDTSTWQPAWAGLAAKVGPFVAGFPVLPTAHASGLADDPHGCPNAWIVDQGKDLDHQNVSFIGPGGVPQTRTLYYPPQLTGFQTTNKVRSIAHVESALFNLVYNTNAVFIELYEDSIWQIGRTRGTGPNAIALDDPATPVRLGLDATGASICDPAVSCYSKNLSQWAEELHARREIAAGLWSGFGGTSYPALEHPFPKTYRQTFVNTTGVPEYHAYINPDRCDPALINFPANGVPSALGAIRVRP